MPARRKTAVLAVALLLAALPLASAQLVTVRTMGPDLHVWVNFNSSGEVSLSTWSRNAGRELTPVLASIVHCQGATRLEGPNSNTVICSNALHRDGLVLEGVVDLAPIARRLDASTEAELWVTGPRLGFDSASTAMTDEDGGAARWSRSISFKAGSAPSAIHFRFGYLPGQLAAIFLPLTVLALALILIAAIMARAGLAVLSRSAVMLGTIVWIAAFGQSGADGALRILLFGKFYAGLAAVLLEFWPPLICIALGVALGNRMRAGQPRKATGAQVLVNLAFIPLLLTSAVGSLPSLTDGNWLVGIMWLLAAPIFLLARRAWNRSRGHSKLRLASGEIKERLSALAARAGCPQVKIYISFSRRDDISNAFALPGRFILLTAALVRSLSKREVDAIAAHELSHFRHSNRGLWIALVLAMFMSMAPMRDMFIYLPGGLFTVMLVPIALYIASLRGMRQREYAADAGAVALTADPRAMISSLARLDRNNGRRRMNPVAVWFSDHPSISNRIRAMAAAARLDSAEVERLCNADDPGDRYELAEEANGGAIFTLDWQKTNAGIYGWLVLLGSSAAGLQAASLLSRFSSAWFGGFGIVPLILAIAFGCTFTKCLASAFMSVNFAWLGRRLKSRIGVNGQLVGLAMDSEPCLYNGFRFSDAGLLRFAQGRLCYTSERISIALNPADVTELSMVAASPSTWTRRQPMVRFHHPESGAVQAFILHPVALLPAQRRLLNQLEQWKRSATSTESTSLSGFNPIPGQRFSNMTVADATRGFRLPALLTLTPAILALVSDKVDWWFLACALLVCAASYLFMILPAMLYRQPSPSVELAPAEAKN